MDADVAARLANNVTQLREARGLTQQQMAKLAGLPRATWAHLESGNANPTQPVLGEGKAEAEVMLVGEQPGDREDLEGHPFVGPAGRVLDQGLEQAGIPRDDAYITNVVKHFRYQLRGKRRIHQTPDRWHVTACLPWLHAELKMVNPEALAVRR